MNKYILKFINKYILCDKTCTSATQEGCLISFRALTCSARQQRSVPAKRLKQPSSLSRPKHSLPDHTPLQPQCDLLGETAALSTSETAGEVFDLFKVSGA